MVLTFQHSHVPEAALCKSVQRFHNPSSVLVPSYPPDDDPVWMRAIYAGDTPVGFLMTSEAPDRGDYFLWRLMIDARFQGNGYGEQAVKLLIERIRRTPDAKCLVTSHLKGDGDAGGLYEKLGFSYTGEVMGGADFVMRMDFRGSGKWRMIRHSRCAG